MRWAEMIRPHDWLLRQFAGLLVLAGGIGALWLTWAGVDSVPLLSLAGAALLAGGLGLIWPRSLSPLFVGWMVLAWPIAWIVSMTTLAVVFYVVLTPVALVLRLLGRDALQRRLDPQRESYWEERPPLAEPTRYLRQY